MNIEKFGASIKLEKDTAPQVNYMSIAQEASRNALLEEAKAMSDIIAKFPISVGDEKPTIKKIHFSGDVTVVVWSDKTKTLVRRQNDEFDDREKAVLACIAKKFLGTNKSKSNWLDKIKPAYEKAEAERNRFSPTATTSEIFKDFVESVNSVLSQIPDKINNSSKENDKNDQ